VASLDFCSPESPFFDSSWVGFIAQGIEYRLSHVSSKRSRGQV